MKAQYVPAQYLYTETIEPLTNRQCEGTVCPGSRSKYRNDWFWESLITESVKALYVQAQYLYTEMIDSESHSPTDSVAAQYIHLQKKKIDLGASD